LEQKINKEQPSALSIIGRTANAAKEVNRGLWDMAGKQKAITI